MSDLRSLYSGCTFTTITTLSGKVEANFHYTFNLNQSADSLAKALNAVLARGNFQGVSSPKAIIKFQSPATKNSPPSCGLCIGSEQSDAPLDASTLHDALCMLSSSKAFGNNERAINIRMQSLLNQGQKRSFP